ncbi:YicC family protein [Synergistales bacterium]|nr:YicC family protein [Synergistales bacterium]
MFLSMTGFGRAERDFKWGTVVFEVTSVNHRYQEISVRLPRELAQMENNITVSLRNMISRGKIRLSAEIKYAPHRNAARLDMDALSSYYGQIKQAAQRCGSPLPDIAQCLSLPGVCDSFDGYWSACDGDKDAWEELLRSCGDAIMDMKKSEGAKLAVAVEQDLNIFEGLTHKMSERWGHASQDALLSLRARVEKIMERFGLDIDENRVASEVSIMADKWDVSEEIARLAAHISKFREISAGASEGRKLDFLIQEMNREINTMGSKVCDAEFRWIVVEAKSCLERIREQIQNIE